MFLFGPNGLGKTSIVEAIRWCLFGLASRSGDIIKNQFYAGSCTVQIRLQGPDGHWTMQRLLGVSGGGSGRLTVRDPTGRERNLEDVFPQLSRIGPKEGTHVIYAAQQPSSRRPEADISDFRYVVFRYLGLEDVPRLVDVLLDLSTEWKSQESELLSEADKLKEELSERITELDDKIRRIVSNPPWGPTITPTWSGTKTKIDSLAGESRALGAQWPNNALDNLEPVGKIITIETAINKVLEGGASQLNEQLDDKCQALEQGNSIYQRALALERDIEETSADEVEVANRLTSVLDGVTIEGLQEQYQQAKGKFEKAQYCLDIARSSLNYIKLAGGTSPNIACPVCSTEVQLHNTILHLEQIEDSGDMATKELLEQRVKLRIRMDEVQTLTKKQVGLESCLTRMKSELYQILHKAREKLQLPSTSPLDEIGKVIEGLKNTIKELRDAMQSQSEAAQSWGMRISQLREEVKFHQGRRLKEQIESVRSGMTESIYSQIKDLAELRDIAKELRRQLNSHLDKRLDMKLPPLAEEMTEVYLRLTEGPTFDAITIKHQEKEDEESMTLDLRVSSSRGSGTWGVDDGILNGQALNAIHLVPYFVFSRYQEDPLLDLLLLDDPTQAFDTQKIALLLKELSDAASHATLFIATHEEDRFLPLLKKFFQPDEIKAFRAVGLDEDGPHLEDVSIVP